MVVGVCLTTLSLSLASSYIHSRETTGINGNPNTPDTVACWVLSFIMTGSMKRDLNSLFNMLRLQSLRNSECRKMPGFLTQSVLR